MTSSAVEGQHGGTDVTGRVGVHERAADRAAVPDLRVGDVLDRLREQRGVARARAGSSRTSL